MTPIPPRDSTLTSSSTHFVIAPFLLRFVLILLVIFGSDVSPTDAYALGTHVDPFLANSTTNYV